MAQLLVVARAQIAGCSFDAAIQSAKKATQVFEKLKDSAGAVEASCYLVKALVGKGDLAEASKQAAAASKKFSSDKAVAAAMTCMDAEICLAKGETDKALDVAKSAVSLYEALKDGKGKGEALVLSGKAYLFKKDPKEALEAAKAAVREFVKSADKHGEATAWAIAMEAKFASGAYQAGVSSGNAALALFGECGDDFETASIFLKLTAAAVEQKEPVSALATGTKAMRLYKDMNNLEMQVSALAYVVQAHIDNGKPEAGVAVAKQTIASMKKAGVAGKLIGLATKSVYMATFAKGNEAETAEVEKEVLSILQETGEKELESEFSAEVAKKKAKKTAEELSEEEKQELHSAEKAVLIEMVEAYKEKNKGAFKNAFWRLQQSKILTQDEVNAVVWPALDHIDNPIDQYCEFDWIKFAALHGNDTYCKVLGERQGIYMVTRLGGMNYGPNFRQIDIGMGRMEPFVNPKQGQPSGHGIGVLTLHNEIVPEGDWEMQLGWHAGMLDQGLASQMLCGLTQDGPHPDVMWKSNFQKAAEEFAAAAAKS